jgi:integrase/recombinase XerD
MVKIVLKYLVEDVDRHGNVRLYVRLPGRQKIRIRSVPGTEEFMSAYHAALTGIDGEDQEKKYKTPVKGSFGFVCLTYYASPVFKALDISTQKWRRRSLDKICEHHGHKPIAEMRSKHVRYLRDEKAAKPGAARNRLKALRALFAWALEEELVDHDPTQGVKPIAYTPKPYHSWTIREIEAFEGAFPIGTKARFAMALMLYTTGRREDAVRLGPQHVRNNRVKFRQAKNEHRQNPVEIDIPLHPDLAEIIKATPSRHMTFLTTEYGKPFSPNGFGNKFREWCNQAGLSHCSAHGLRKAAATFLAEGGATSREIMAVTGHKSLEEVERYTRSARQQILADSAMSKFKR